MYVGENTQFWFQVSLVITQPKVQFSDVELEATEAETLNTDNKKQT